MFLRWPTINSSYINSPFSPLPAHTLIELIENCPLRQRVFCSNQGFKVHLGTSAHQRRWKQDTQSCTCRVLRSSPIPHRARIFVLSIENDPGIFRHHTFARDARHLVGVDRVVASGPNILCFFSRAARSPTWQNSHVTCSNFARIMNLCCHRFAFPFIHRQRKCTCTVCTSSVSRLFLTTFKCTARRPPAYDHYSRHQRSRRLEQKSKLLRQPKHHLTLVAAL